MIEEKTEKIIPAMTPVEVHDYLRELGRNWTGQGVAMELGCWLGASSIPLLEGLVEAGYNKHFWAFDRWIANEQQARKAKMAGVHIELGEQLLNKYLMNVNPTYHKLICIAGMLPLTLESYTKAPIEICIFDAPKRNPCFISCIKELYKYWVPGVTILGLLDYYFYRSKSGIAKQNLMAPVEFIESNVGCFTRLEEWDSSTSSCMFFRYEKPLISI